jgi:glycosyltransferase involved in cell wall biosynthesis
LWTLQESLFIRHCDVVITVSDSIAAELERIYAIRRPVTILNVPDLKVPTRSRRLRSWLGIAEENPIVLYQGGVAGNRGIPVMIEAAMQLPDVVVIILGTGPLMTTVSEWVKDNGWAERVFLPGRVPLGDLLEYTASADIGVSLIENACLSYYYSLPNKLFEYLQAGIPVIASNFPEMRAIIRDYGVGIAVDPASPADVAMAMRLLLDDQPLLRKRMAAGAQLASKTYSWDVERRRLLALYAELE